MSVHIYTPSGGADGRIVVVHETDDGTDVYQFRVEESGGERKATFEGSPSGSETVPAAVDEGLEAAGYSVIDDDGDDDLRTDGGESDSSVEAIRNSLHTAKDVSADERDEYIKSALGEVQDLRARAVIGAADLHSLLTSVLTEPDEEDPYFINRALSELENIEERLKPEDTGEPNFSEGVQDEPPESVRWLDEDHGVVELEATRPLIEWFELEAEQNDFDDIQDWMLAQLWVSLTEDLQKRHGFTADVEVEVPHDYARRVSLWWDHRQTEGEPSASDLDAFIFDHMRFEPTWMLGGEPWELVEPDCGEGSDPTDV